MVGTFRAGNKVTPNLQALTDCTNLHVHTQDATHTSFNAMFPFCIESHSIFFNAIVEVPHFTNNTWPYAPAPSFLTTS